MKILILANNDIGLYKFRVELINELLKNHDVLISLPNGEYIPLLEEQGCKFIDTKVDRRGINPITDMNLIKHYFTIIQRENPDLVLTYTIKPNIYGGLVCRLKKIPYAINITGLGTAFEKRGILKFLVTNMYRISCKRARVVFFENEGNKRIFLKSHIVNEKQTYRLNGAGVNTNKYQVYPYPKGDKIKFLFMGRIMSEKGIDELFMSMRRLIANGVDCELELLGFYEENYKDIISKYESEGWLHYHGYQKEVTPFIYGCHCFVLPSWHEGMANTNLECASCGRPIITTNIHGCKEAVIDGVSGFLCNKRDENSLYDALSKFVSLSYDQRRNMGLEGRKLMEEEFDKKRVVKDTIDKLEIGKKNE